MSVDEEIYPIRFLGADEAVENQSDVFYHLGLIFGQSEKYLATARFIDDVKIENGRIDVVIEKSGSYTLTGSNERNYSQSK